MAVQKESVPCRAGSARLMSATVCGACKVYESEWKTRRLVTSVIAPDGDDPGCKDILFDRNYEDAYTGEIVARWMAAVQCSRSTP